MILIGRPLYMEEAVIQSTAGLSVPRHRQRGPQALLRIFAAQIPGCKSAPTRVLCHRNLWAALLGTGPLTTCLALLYLAVQQEVLVGNSFLSDCKNDKSFPSKKIL